MKIEPNHIYLLQPSMNIFIEHGLLRVRRQDRSGRAVNLPINLFFKSLGLYLCQIFFIYAIKYDKRRYFKEKTIGIILSGTGSDGMDGIRCIKEQSGMVMVQNNSAK
jgi:two-component system CheB/CheR fusion protein